MVGSVVVVDKHGGKFKELHAIGIASTPEEVEELSRQGQSWIKNHSGIQELDFEGADRKHEELAAAARFLDYVDSILLNGAKLILDKVCDSAGFNKKFQTKSCGILWWHAPVSQWAR